MVTMTLDYSKRDNLEVSDDSEIEIETRSKTQSLSRPMQENICEDPGKPPPEHEEPEHGQTRKPTH